MTFFSTSDEPGELRFSTIGCTRYVQTPMLSLGSEKRSMEDSGWESAQKTSESHSIAFSLLPVEVEFSDAPPILLAPTTVGMTKPSRSFTRSPRNRQGQRTIFLSLNAQLARDACAVHDTSAFDRTNPFPTQHGPSSAAALAMAMQLERLVFESKNGLEPMVFEEHAMQIVFTSLKTVYQSLELPCGPTSVPENQERRAKINHAIELMCRHPSEHWSLAKISAAVEISPAYISRIFRAHTGRTLSQCLQLIRIARAMEQLPDRRGNLIGVALDCGFASHSQMATAFTNTVGITPSALAKGDTRAIRDSIERLHRSWSSAR